MEKKAARQAVSVLSDDYTKMSLQTLIEKWINELPKFEYCYEVQLPVRCSAERGDTVTWRSIVESQHAEDWPMKTVGPVFVRCMVYKEEAPAHIDSEGEGV